MYGLPFPQIDPIIIHLWGPIALRWYNLAYIVGFGLGYAGVIWWINARQQLQRPLVDNAFHWVLISVLMGGRIGEFLFYPQPLEHFLYIWQGGMSFHGALLGLIIGIYLFSRRYQQPFLTWIDHISLVAPMGLFWGRLANFINEELIGRVTDLPWAVRFPSGGYLPRHPTQIYEAIFEGFVLFIALNTVAYRTSLLKKPGHLSGLFLIGYGLFRFGIEAFKVPDGMIGPLTTGQALCLPMVVVGLILVFRKQA